jgi:hypothetical protein
MHTTALMRLSLLASSHCPSRLTSNRMADEGVGSATTATTATTIGPAAQIS